MLEEKAREKLAVNRQHISMEEYKSTGGPKATKNTRKTRASPYEPREQVFT
jgi:hypothetical protein